MDDIYIYIYYTESDSYALQAHLQCAIVVELLTIYKMFGVGRSSPNHSEMANKLHLFSISASYAY